MSAIDRLTIVGTSHIAPQSLKDVEDTIIAQEPDIVALELDKKRLFALLNPQADKTPRWRDYKHVGLKGYLFARLGAWAEKKLGAKVGVSPGSEMLAGLRAAQQTGARVSLIDQDIEITLKKFSKALTWREKWHFFVDIIKGVVFRKGIEFDLSSVPSQEIITKLTSDVKERYPSIYRVLIDDRNKLMAKRLARLLHANPETRIVAVVGAGHVEEIKALVKKHLNRIASSHTKRDEPS